jgi:hypothetical protein
VLFRSVPFQFETVVSIGGKRAGVEGVNISMTGMLCNADLIFKNDAVCRVSIKLADQTRIAVSGKVIRSGPDGAAITFTSISARSFSHLKKLVQYNSGDADAIDSELMRPAFK